MRVRSLMLAFGFLVALCGWTSASPLIPSAAVTVALDQPSGVEIVRWRRHHRHWHRHRHHRRHWHHHRHRHHWHHRRGHGHHPAPHRRGGGLHFSRPAGHSWIEPRQAGR
ncbi:hypothetical protein [Methylobacterium sp. JK268]